MQAHRLFPGRTVLEHSLFGVGNTTANSWGGRPIYSPEDTKFHLIAAEMTQHCTLSHFDNNSAVIHGVSSSATGPFVKVATVFPPFGHNPTVTRSPDGYYLIYFIGKERDRQVDCTAPGMEQLETAAGAPLWKPDTDVINVAWSKSIYGPWQQRSILRAASPTDPQTRWNCHNSNPAPLVLANGTVLLMYRGSACDRAGSGCGKHRPNTCEQQGIAVATHWNSTYHRRPEPIALSPGGFEDAFFWRSSRGFHALFHAKAACGDELVGVCGAMAFSLDS